ncbi:MAG: U32 family peptidase [Desulfotalea sp.]
MKNEKKIELLAPGGDLDSIKAAILAGADAVYCGLDKFNARNRAVNIDFNDLMKIINLAHEHNCQVFLTMNIVITTGEIVTIINLLNKLVNTGIDALIVQDLGLFYLISTYFKNIPVHASTQLTTHNKGQISIAKMLGANRVNLCRELNLDEIKDLSSYAHNEDLATEVFVHGSNCIGFSGLCYFSSVMAGNSGNRGRCSQPCRDKFTTTSSGFNFPFNLKDNSAFFDIKNLAEAGVDSFKIEGRIKKYHYVHSVVKTWRQQLQYFYDTGMVGKDNADLFRVFNRDFSNHLLKGRAHKDAFIDNPRDNSALHRASFFETDDSTSLERAKRELYDEKTEIIEAVGEKINSLALQNTPITIRISGNCGEKLKVLAFTTGEDIVILSRHELSLVAKQKKTVDPMSKQSFLKTFKNLAGLGYAIDNIELSGLVSNLILPFSDIKDLGRNLFAKLNNSHKFQSPIDLPKIKTNKRETITPKLSVILSSKNDLPLLKVSNADFYFQLPSSLNERIDEYLQIFEGRELVPVFPAIIIGKDFEAAEDFLLRLKPNKIISNNLGIAHLANKMKISWLAGPYINVANPYSLKCLKENLSCSGAFISSELSMTQIGSLHAPEDFETCYSIFHPSLLFTSKHCLFQSVTGCHKENMDDTCLKDCQKVATATGVNGKTLHIEKKSGNYPSLYDESSFLNSAIVKNIQNKFHRFFIDISKHKEFSKMEKINLLDLFQKLLDGEDDADKKIKGITGKISCSQYKTGF